MKKIFLSELKPGMVLQNPVYTPDNQKILLSYGTKLNDFMIKKLVAMGIREVDIADPYTVFISPKDQMAISLKEAYYKIIKKYSPDKAESNLSDIMVAIANEVKATVDKICENEEILDFCIQMKICLDGRLFNHSVMTSVFSGLIAGTLGMQDTMYPIMVGALLHNIGYLEMPFLIGHKNMNSQEELLWKEHPVYGYYIAIQHNIPRSIAELILHYKENWDGSGFPNKLKGEAIPAGSRIISICSTVSSHIHFDNMQPYESMEYIYGGSNFYFDKQIVNAFVSNITLYPLGALVRLTTGEVGIIANVRQNRGPRPIINVYYNRFNKPLSQPKTVDLGKERTVFISEVL